MHGGGEGGGGQSILAKHTRVGPAVSAAFCGPSLPISPYLVCSESEITNSPLRSLLPAEVPGSSMKECLPNPTLAKPPPKLQAYGASSVLGRRWLPCKDSLGKLPACFPRETNKRWTRFFSATSTSFSITAMRKHMHN